MTRLLPVLTAVFILLSACGNNSAGADYKSYTVQERIDEMAEKGDLMSRAFIESGIRNDIGEDDYPLSLFVVRSTDRPVPDDWLPSNGLFVPEDDTLSDYLTEQGLTEEEFLAHPKLRSFVEGHLITADIDLPTLASTKNASETFKTVNGESVTITVAAELTPGEDDYVFANGVAISDFCAFDPTPAETGGYGQVCYARAPLITDFDWSD